MRSCFTPSRSYFSTRSLISLYLSVAVFRVVWMYCTTSAISCFIPVLTLSTRSLWQMASTIHTTAPDS